MGPFAPVCVCVCVCESERETDRQTDRHRQTETDNQAQGAQLKEECENSVSGGHTVCPFTVGCGTQFPCLRKTSSGPDRAPSSYRWRN